MRLSIILVLLGVPFGPLKSLLSIIQRAPLKTAPFDVVVSSDGDDG